MNPVTLLAVLARAITLRARDVGAALGCAMDVTGTAVRALLTGNGSLGPVASRTAAGSVLVVALLASGCSAFERPDRGMSDSTFVEVLVDLHLAQARLDEGLRTDSTLRTEILRKHNVDEARLDAKIKSLVDDNDRYLDLYGRVVDRLTEEQEKLK